MTVLAATKVTDKVSGRTGGAGCGFNFAAAFKTPDRRFSGARFGGGDRFREDGWWQSQVQGG